MKKAGSDLLSSFQESDMRFLQAIQDSPTDDFLRLVYADWLEEQGEEARSRYIRLECQIADERAKKGRLTKDSRRELKQLRDQLDMIWLMNLARIPIEKSRATPEFEFECPKQWELLTRTDRADIRFCESCRKQVYFCHTIEAAQIHATRGRCVAVDLGVMRRKKDLDVPRRVRKMGRMLPPDRSGSSSGTS